QLTLTITTFIPAKRTINKHMNFTILFFLFSVVSSWPLLGQDIHSVNDRGSTPLEIAQRTKAAEMTNWLIASGADPKKVRQFSPKGPYFGETPPGMTAKVFAPNFISTEEYEFGSIFSADGAEFFYGVEARGGAEIRYTRLVNNQWTQPEVLLPAESGYNDPFLSPDEQRLYFISPRAKSEGGERDDYDIWYVERQKDGWSTPINAGPNINSPGNEYYISFTKDGTMYFSSNVSTHQDEARANMDIYYAKFKDGAFQPAVVLNDAINTAGYEADVFVDPDEQYIIFCSTRRGGLGRGDLYISFKEENGDWTKAISMGDKINTRHHELCPFVSPDGKYFFYTSDEDIYWISTGIIDELRKGVLD
ncbi:MAG: hypothetical protein AAF828_04545, partial [Bacteroidota bacterium]